MAGSSLLALLDDIAAVLDDVAVMTKVAAKKTAGVLGDDLALNAEQVSGVRADRELPVVWAVFKGSAKNKLFLVPAALAISAFIPFLIQPLLMLGGAYLCYEGAEKIFHKFFHSAKEDDKHHKELVDALADGNVDMEAFEKEKIKGAIRTDFILSAEIIVIALGAVKESAFTTQVSVVVGIATLMTIGVYGLVAGIVKMDDAGYYLLKNKTQSIGARISRFVGKGLLLVAPKLMKSLAVIGTVAMFMVGGGILVHGVPASHELMHAIENSLVNIAYIGEALNFIAPSILNAIFGLISGGIILTAVSAGGKFFGNDKPAA